MAVQITKYYSRTVRQGTRPSNTGEVDGETAPIVNPNPNQQPVSFLGLTDVFDSTYNGNTGFVPVVSAESGLTLQPLPQVEQNGLVSGGIVQWTGSGYIFNVSGSYYRIQGTLYSSDATQKTLSTPDATNNRIDVFAVDNTGAVVVIEGTPSATPVKPQIDPATQLELTSVLVIASSTEPTLTEELIYDENVEWTGSSSGTGTVAFNSTNDPYQGTISVETTNIQNGFYIQFNNGSTIDISGYQTFGFELNLKEAMPNNQNLYITFLDGSASVASNIVSLQFDKTLTGYQFVAIALNAVNFITNDIQYVRFSFVRTGGSPTFGGYFLDVVKLEGGINPPITTGSFTSLSDTPNTYSGFGGYTVQVKSDESGLEFVAGGGGASTFLALSDTPSSYSGQAGLFPRVNGGETALEFDSVSPYDLDQEGATDGQVLTWVNANSRYEPVTPSGGSSLWTDATTFIYRDSPVQIGKTTATDGGSGNNSTLVVQSKFSSPTDYRIINFLDNSGTSLYELNEDGTSFHSEGAGYGVDGVSNIAALYRSSTDTSASVAIRAQNQSGTTLFTVDGDSQAEFPSTVVGFYRSPLTNFAITAQSQSSGGGPIAFYTAAGSLQALVDNSMHWRSSGGAYFGRQSSATLGSNRVVIRGIGTGTTNTLLLEDSAGTDTFAFLDNGNLSIPSTNGAKIGITTSQKIGFWNATPVIQQTTAITAATFVANTSTILDDSATFDNYTIGQVVAALRLYGILA